MRTEASLVDALNELAAEADRPEELRERITLMTGPGPRPCSVRRRWAPVAAAVGAVAAVAVAAMVVAGLQGGAAGNGPAASEPVGGLAQKYPCANSGGTRFDNFGIRSVAGLGAARELVSCSGIRSAALVTQQGAVIGQALVFRSGVFDSSVSGGARRVSGHGIDGYFLGRFGIAKPGASCAEILPVALNSEGFNTFPCSRSPRVTWQYAPNSWAMVSVDNDRATSTFLGIDPLDKLLTVAAAVRPNESSALRIPFRVSAVPASLRTVSTQVHPQGEQDLDHVVSAVPTGPMKGDALYARGVIDAPIAGGVTFGVVGGSCPTGTACAGTVGVEASHVAATAAQLAQVTGRHITIGGQPAVVRTGTTIDDRPGMHRALDHWMWVAVVRGGWTMVVSTTDSTHGIGLAQLSDIVQATTFGHSGADSSTWFSVATALPR